MRNDLFLKSDVAKNLYDAVRDLPIVDYHCHLSPKEILEDREFPDIAQIWLGGDHYKWRLMRACGAHHRRRGAAREVPRVGGVPRDCDGQPALCVVTHGAFDVFRH